MNGLTGTRRCARPVRIALARVLGGDIDGAWWPHSGSVASELPELIEALHRPLGEIIDILYRVNAEGLSVEASNPRHAHEWSVFKEHPLPDGKVLLPGVIDSVTNFVEHPDLVAERIMRFTEVVGKENVIATTDCGFGTSVRTTARVHPTVVWAKLKSLSEGAKLASQKLLSRQAVSV